MKLPLVGSIWSWFHWWPTILRQAILLTLNILCWLWTFLDIMFWIVSDSHRLEELVRFKWIIGDIDIPIEVALFKCHVLWSLPSCCLGPGLFPRFLLIVSTWSLILSRIWPRAIQKVHALLHQFPMIQVLTLFIISSPSFAIFCCILRPHNLLKLLISSFFTFWEWRNWSCH